MNRRKKKMGKEEAAATESTQEVNFLVEQTCSKLAWVGVYGIQMGNRETKRREKYNLLSPRIPKEGPGDTQGSSK